MVDSVVPSIRHQYMSCPSARWRYCSLVVCLFWAVCLSGCATIYNPATGRQEFIFIDTAVERRLGQQAATEVDRQLPLSRDPQRAQRIEQIGRKLAAVSDRQDLRFQFYLVEGSEVNAFALPGGFIYLYAGLLDHVRSDDELANVLGHEIGHVAARHHVKQMQSVLGYQVLSSLVFRDTKSPELQRGVAMMFDLISKGYSREDELEADRLGMRYAQRAGYQPLGMVSFLELLQQLQQSEPSSVLTIFQTHPAVSERIIRARQEIEHLGLGEGEIALPAVSQ